jgi:hypothetical protein
MAGGYPQPGPAMAGPYGGAPMAGGFPQPGAPYPGSTALALPTALAYGLNYDQLQELRQAALYGNKRLTKRNKMLDEFRAIDGGAKAKFNGMGIVLGLFYLIYWTKKRGLLIFAAVFLINLALIIVNREYVTPIHNLIWISTWILSSCLVNRWTYIITDNEITEAIKLSQGNFEQTRATLVKKSSEHGLFTFISLILFVCYLLLVSYLITNLPVCNNEDYLELANSLIYESLNEQTGLSLDYLKQNVSVQITDIVTKTNSFKSCLCSATLTLKDAKNTKVFDLEYSVDTSQGSFGQYYVKVNFQ